MHHQRRQRSTYWCSSGAGSSSVTLWIKNQDSWLSALLAHCPLLVNSDLRSPCRFSFIQAVRDKSPQKDEEPWQQLVTSPVPASAATKPVRSGAFCMRGERVTPSLLPCAADLPHLNCVCNHCSWLGYSFGETRGQNVTLVHVYCVLSVTVLRFLDWLTDYLILRTLPIALTKSVPVPVKDCLGIKREV